MLGISNTSTIRAVSLDAEREWAYYRESHIGKLDKGLDEAHRKGWTVVEMKRDWSVVYPGNM